MCIDFEYVIHTGLMVEGDQSKWHMDPGMKSQG